MSEAFTAGRELAERHRRAGADQEPVDLANLSERERDGGWTFRSALVRFAQPEPLRAAVIMDFIRRSEAALHPLQAALGDGRLIELAAVVESHLQARPESGPRPDAGEAEAVTGYCSVVSLDDQTIAALPLVAAVLLLDDLGQQLASWAPLAPAPAPIAEVDTTCSELRRRFEHLAVPVETGPPGPGRGRRR